MTTQFSSRGNRLARPPMTENKAHVSSVPKGFHTGGNSDPLFTGCLPSTCGFFLNVTMFNPDKDFMAEVLL